MLCLDYEVSDNIPWKAKAPVLQNLFSDRWNFRWKSRIPHLRCLLQEYLSAAHTKSERRWILLSPEKLFPVKDLEPNDISKSSSILIRHDPWHYFFGFLIFDSSRKTYYHSSPRVYDCLHATNCQLHSSRGSRAQRNNPKWARRSVSRKNSAT